MARMTYLLYFSAILAGLFAKKSKTCTTWIYMVMVLLAGFRYWDADYNSYYTTYNRLSQINRVDVRYIGYHYLQMIFSNLGLKFEEYIVFVYIIGFAVLIFSIKLLTSNVNQVLAFYLIFAFGIDVIQMKSFCSEVISFLGIAILLKYYSKNEQLRKNNRVIFSFFCLMILALVFHFSAAFYLLSGLVYLMIDNKKIEMKKLVLVIIVVVVFVYGNGLSYILSLANKIGVIGDMEYLVRWSKRNTRLGWITPSFLIVMIVFAATYIYPRSLDVDKEKIAVKNFILTAIFIIPFLIMNTTFNRLVRIYMLLLYIIFVNARKRMRVHIKQGLSYFVFILCIIYAFICDILPNYERTLGALLKYNRLFL